VFASERHVRALGQLDIGVCQPTKVGVNPAIASHPVARGSMVWTGVTLDNAPSHQSNAGARQVTMMGVQKTRQ
jgi:hypothetical protein